MPPPRCAPPVIAADNGYHSEANLKALAEAGIDASLTRTTGNVMDAMQTKPYTNKSLLR